MEELLRTAWQPPPSPDRDLWWQAQRITVPDTGDWTARHRRGVVRLPWDLGDRVAGQLVDAWVCCDPACGGVELNAAVLDLNHLCCDRIPCCPKHPEPRWRAEHHVGLGTVGFTGSYHGWFTPYWEPGGAR